MFIPSAFRLFREKADFHEDFLHAQLPAERPLAGPSFEFGSGTVEVSGSSRDEALTKMRNELQYRIEWCRCGGVSGDTVDLQLKEGS